MGVALENSCSSENMHQEKEIHGEQTPGKKQVCKRVSQSHR